MVEENGQNALQMKDIKALKTTNQAWSNVISTYSLACMMVCHHDGVSVATRCSGSVCTAAGCRMYTTLVLMCMIGLMNGHVCFDWQKQMARWPGFVSTASSSSYRRKSDCGLAADSFSACITANFLLLFRNISPKIERWSHSPPWT